MIRRPLRPLARILRARAEGRTRTSSRPRSAPPGRGAPPRRAGQGGDAAPAARGGLHPRLLDGGGADGAGLGRRCRSSRAAACPAEPIHAQRADIVDRNGMVLATNIVTASLYAQPEDLIDPRRGGAGAGRDLPRPRRRRARGTVHRRAQVYLDRADDLARAAPAGARPRRAGAALRAARDPALSERCGGGARARRRELRARGGATPPRWSAPPGVERVFDARLRDPAGSTSRSGSRSTSRCRPRSRTCWPRACARCAPRARSAS